MKKMLVDRIRPNKMSHLILPARLKKDLGDGVLYRHLLLYGPSGCGKTSAAYLMAKVTSGLDQNTHDISDEPNILYINASESTSVDIIRGKIRQFCSNQSLLAAESGIKTVILDEFDGASTAMMVALNGFIEEFQEFVRFIATCNTKHKIKPSIVSRIKLVDFHAQSIDEKLEWMGLMTNTVNLLLQKLNIKTDKDIADKIVEINYPDFRRIYDVIAEWEYNKVTEIKMEDLIMQTFSYKEIYELIIKGQDPIKNFQLLVNKYASDNDAILDDLGRNFINYIISQYPKKTQHIPDIIICVAKYQNMMKNRINETVCMMACVFELQNIIKK